MTKPTVAANAASMPASRRSFLKATGAVASLAALAVPASAMPRAEDPQTADADLLAMGRELEALWTRERELSSVSMQLGALAEQMRPDPAPVLAAFEHEGQRFFEKTATGWRENLKVADAVEVLFRQGRSEFAEVLDARQAWRAGGAEARRLSGYTASEQEEEAVGNAMSELCDRIIVTPAVSPAGLKVKLRALSWCYPDVSASAALASIAGDAEDYTSSRIVASSLRDALGMLGVESAME